MYLISKYEKENEGFVKIVSTYQFTLYATNKFINNDYIMKNTNYFVNPNSKHYVIKILDDIISFNNINIKVNKLELENVLNDEIIALVCKQQELGTIKYNIDGLGYIDKLIVNNNVAKKINILRY